MLRKGCSAPRQGLEPFFRGRQLASEELAFAAKELECEGEIVAPLPAVLGQQTSSGGEILQRRDVGGRAFGALAGNQVELGNPLTLLLAEEQLGATVELVDDIKDLLGELVGGHSCKQHSADAQMHLRAQLLRDQRIG